MNLSRFAEQTELAEVFKSYYAAYKELWQYNDPWPKFNDFQVLRSLDGVGVNYSPETTLFAETEKKRKEESSVAKNIGYRLIDCAAYFLAQNIPPEQVPAQLRLCLAVCHDNLHWTGVMATADLFQQAYKELYATWLTKEDTYRTGADQNILHNRAKNAIFEQLGIILEPKQLATDECEKNKIIVNFFQKDKPMLIELYDSMNSARYTQRICQSLDNLSSVTDIHARPCSQQRGNTCGDHTTINLFAAGIMHTVPVINRRDYPITSTSLRQITDSVDELANAGNIQSVLKSISDNGAPEQIIPVIADENDPINTCNKVANNVYSLINDFYRLDPNATTSMIQLAINKASNTMRPEDELVEFLSAENKKFIFDELVKLFSINRLSTEHEDSVPYWALAIVIAKDYCSDIEHEHLCKQQSEIEQKKGVQSHSPDGMLTQYEKIFTQLKNKITNTIEDFERNKRITRKKHPWQLGWAGSHSYIRPHSTDYYVPKAIKDIYNAIHCYEENSPNITDENSKRRYAAATFKTISRILESKAENQKPGMMATILCFFRDLVTKMLGCERSDETKAEYASMKTMISEIKTTEAPTGLSI